MPLLDPSTRDGGYAFDSWTPYQGLRSAVTCKRVCETLITRAGRKIRSASGARPSYGGLAPHR